MKLLSRESLIFHFANRHLEHLKREKQKFKTKKSNVGLIKNCLNNCCVKDDENKSREKFDSINKTLIFKLYINHVLFIYVKIYKFF